MATSKDKAKERELRRLKRENVREQEASARQREEFRAVQAQKENYEIMLRRKEEPYVEGIGIYNTLLLPCGRSRLLQRRGRVFAFRSCGPGSIPTSGGWDFFCTL